jgi:hypothetical protein
MSFNIQKFTHTNYFPKHRILQDGHSMAIIVGFAGAFYQPVHLH